jgi:hypothetical protein
MNICKSCGGEAPLSFRFCPRCGTQLYEGLERSGADPDSFVPLLNSLYNLLAVKRGDVPHPDRGKHLNTVSESAMSRRCSIDHNEMCRDIFRSLRFRPEASQALDDLLTLSLSNALAGYAYRAVEEMICKRKILPMPSTERDSLISTVWRNSDLKESAYGELRSDDPVEHRLLFCLALNWNSGHDRYTLASQDLHEKWWKTVFGENLELSFTCFENVYRAVGLLANRQPLSHAVKQSVADDVHEELTHGYVVRLAESLYPI